MRDQDYRLALLCGIVAGVILWAWIEALEMRWRLRDIYDELEVLRIVQSRCFREDRTIEAETADDAARVSRPFKEAEWEQLDIPWQAPAERATAPRRKSAV